MGAGIPLLCYTRCTAVRSVMPIFICFTAVRVGVPTYPTVRLGAALVLRFWWMVPFLPLSSFYTAI